MCIKFPWSKPDIKPTTISTFISRDDYLSKLAKCGIQPISLGTPFDSQLAITSKAELNRIAPGLTYSAEDYVAEVADCEDYGMRAMVDAAFKYHCSGIRLCLGWTELGYHGFCIALDTEDNVWWLEPNAGFEDAGVWHKIGEGTYRPDKVLV